MTANQKSATSPASGSALPILLDYVCRNTWAMHEPTLRQMLDILDRHLSGVRLEAGEIDRITAAKRDRGADDREYSVTGEGTAIIPITGIIAKHASMVNGQSQPRGTSVEAIGRQLEAALADRAVEAIFLQIESPGGYIDALGDLGDEIYEAGFTKPVTAFADDLAASAAYWLGSQASAFYASQTAEVGSIGVYSIYIDSSAAYEEAGYKAHIIRSGANKGVGVAGIPITDDQLAPIQNLIDGHYEAFLAAVGRGRADRGPGPDKLRELADGRLYRARQGVALGLIDGVMPLKAALAASPPPLRTEASFPRAAAIDNETLKKKEKTMTETASTATVPGSPDAVAAVAAEAAEKARTAERERIKAITAALPGDGLASVRDKAIAAGDTLTEAKAAAFDAAGELHAAALAAAKGETEKLQGRLDAITAGDTKAVAASVETEGSEASTSAAGDDGEAETFTAAVKAHVAAGLTYTAAFARAASDLPDAHGAWIDAATARRDASRPHHRRSRVRT